MVIFFKKGERMKRIVSWWYLPVVLGVLTGCNGQASSDANNAPKLPIVMIGPSTMYITHRLNSAIDKAGNDCRLEGWGERLYRYANDPDAVYDYAQPGAGAGLFRVPLDKREDYKKDRSVKLLYGPKGDHWWGGASQELDKLGKGILLIQFGGNDARLLHDKYHDIEKEKAAFKANIRFYIDEAKKRHFTPVLITSIEKRILADDGTLQHSRGKFPLWMKEVGKANHVRVLDLNKKSYKEYAKTVNQWDEMFGDCYSRWAKDADGNPKKQDTHFGPKGAQIVAGWVRDLACEDANSTLCQLLQQSPKSFEVHADGFIPPHGIPELKWNHPPKGTQSFAVIIDDADADNWVHWVAINIPADTHAVNQGKIPHGAMILKNQEEKREYRDPSYPDTHRYVAHVYAIDMKDLTEGHTFNKIYNHELFEKKFANHILEKAEIASKE